ncbi:MAG TPA: NADH-quinone oxidoreductase subunit C [Aquificaceae bacterium]|nr:NADH-quinone oxidoreductase subunit C [Aquificaceae bacterium]
MTSLKLVLEGRVVEVVEREPRRLFVEVGSSELREFVEGFWRVYRGRAYLSLISVVDFVEEGVFRVDYVFWLVDEKKLLTVRVRVSRDNPRLPSIADIVPAARVYECEAYDLFGIVFEGNNCSVEGLFKPPSLRGVAPLRRDWGSG